jgi:hypothetical protein
MSRRKIKGWISANWLSIIVGLLLPSILGSLWVLFRSPLEGLSQYILSSLVLMLGIISCILTGVLIYLMKRLLKFEQYVNETFYPNETNQGTFRDVKEQMEHDAEYSKGWEDAIKE